MKHSKTRMLCESALLIALSVALSYIKLFEFPLGGALTPCSMLPLCIVAVRYGTGWGLTAAFCFSWFQILQGGVFGWGLTPSILVASLFLDYILAFTVLGFAGIFRKKGARGAVAGILSVCAARFLIHFLSGVIIWANFEEFVAFGETWVGHPWLYSLCYNGAYMLPETLLTVVAALILFRIPQFRRTVLENHT